MDQAPDPKSREGRDRAEDLMRQHGAMENERAVLDSLYQRIAERVCPEGETFTSKQGVQGELNGEKVFDNTPGLALDRFAAAINSYLVPDSDQWHGLKPEDPDVAEDEEIKEWCEAATDTLFAARYRPRANFSAQMYANFRSLGAFGPWCMFVDEEMGANLRYRSMHLSEVYFGENHQGLVDRVHRGYFELKAYQVEQLAHHPDPAKRWIMPECVRKALTDVGGKRNPHATFRFLHCVYPNDDWRPNRADYQGMAFSSVYVCADDRSVVHVGGYRTMPYAVGRYMNGPRETYGRSPAMTVFRDILMLNEMNKDVIRAAQMALDGPILVSSEGELQPFSMQSRHINAGYVSNDGKLLAHHMRFEGDLTVGLEMIQDRRKSVNDAFMITLFEILVENGNQTATEVLQRAQEKGQIMGPAMTRQQDAIGGIIERELDILMAAGQLPPMPEALLEAGGALAVDFKAPVNRLQKTDKAVGILRTFEVMAGPAEADPTLWEMIDMPKALRVIAEANGAPASVLRTPEEIAERASQREQQANVQTLIDAAPQVSKAALNLTQAQATAANVPQPIPLVAPQ